jgi:hypothetical protein
MERTVSLQKWQGHPHLLRPLLQDCIRRYRYTGSFPGYVFKTLLYASRGLPPLALSLDAHMGETKLRRIDAVVHDDDSGTLSLFHGTPQRR